MNRILTRLKNRIPYSITIKEIKMNDNTKLLDRFNQHKHNYPIIELYHSSRDGMKAINSIMKDGFYNSTPYRGNKGRGIYFANHGLYSLWAGKPYHVLVCHVIGNDKYVTRHHSEILSKKNDSEYVVTDTQICYPICSIIFEVKGRANWANKLCENNNEICLLNKRCDCARYPTIDPKDVI